jgi:hypothetical protein
MVKAKAVTGERVEDYTPVMGGNPENPRWRKFLNGCRAEFKPYAIAIKNALIEENLIPSYGMDCSNNYLFEFSDGRKPVGLSMRAWGDFVSAVVGKKEGYMAYY